MEIKNTLTIKGYNEQLNYMTKLLLYIFRSEPSLSFGKSENLKKTGSPDNSYKSFKTPGQKLRNPQFFYYQTQI